MAGYTIPTNKPFVTTKSKEELLAKKRLSNEARAIRDFCRSHDFTLEVDPVTNEKRLKAVKKTHE